MATGGTAAAAVENNGTSAVQTAFNIDKFDKTVSSWNRWLQRLEGAFTVFSVQENKKVHFLLHFMGQEPFDIVCDKLAPASPYLSNYAALTEVLREHYNPAPLEIMENFRFHLRKQKDGETIQEFVSALRRLAIHCNFGNYLDTALRNQTVFGIRSERIQGRLLESSNLTLVRTVEIATALEVSSRDAAQLHKGSGTNQDTVSFIRHKNKNKKNNFHNNSFTNVKNNSKTNSSICKSPNVNTTGTKINACYRCGSKSHLANNCKHLFRFAIFAKLKDIFWWYVLKKKI